MFFQDAHQLVFEQLHLVCQWLLLIHFFVIWIWGFIFLLFSRFFLLFGFDLAFGSDVFLLLLDFLFSLLLLAQLLACVLCWVFLRFLVWRKNLNLLLNFYCAWGSANTLVDLMQQLLLYFSLVFLAHSLTYSTLIVHLHRT